MKTIISLVIILVFSSFSLAPDQTRMIYGTVKDESGMHLAGVNVLVKGTPRGTQTDVNGKYQMEIPSGATYLVFSFIGYESVERKVKDKSIIHVVMKQALVSLEEVVAVEYDAIQPYEMEVSHVSSSMQGKVAGVAVSAHRGRPMKKSYYAAAYAPEAGYVQHNTEGYSAIHENGFKDVLHNPLSTFSIDVDKASYSNIRRFLS